MLTHLVGTSQSDARAMPDNAAPPYVLEVVCGYIFDTKRMGDEVVVWRSVRVHIAIPVYPIPFGAVHVLL